MPQYVDGPMITPDSVARGVPQMSAGGGKEIHFDSSALRAQYDGGGNPQMDVTNPAYVPEIVTGPTPTPQQLAENIPADVLEAAANGKPVTPEMIARMRGLTPVKTATDVGRAFSAPLFTSQPQPTAVELTIPVGNGVTARVTFTSQPARIHWRKLIRHLEIEAAPPDADEDEYERQERTRLEAAPKEPDLIALAEAALRRQANGNIRPEPAGASQPELPRPVKRRKRKNVSGAAEPGQLARDPASGA
jgi:hypothetical protein